VNLPPGTPVYIGAPANPLPLELSRAIGDALGNIPGVVEAHLPLMYVKDKIDPPAQILVIVLEQQTPHHSLEIKRALSRILPTDFPLDVFEVQPQHEVLPIVRKAKCALSLHRRVN
jgi:hypothetical protein